MSATRPTPSEGRIQHYGEVQHMTPRQFRRFKQKGARLGDLPHPLETYRRAGTPRRKDHPTPGRGHAIRFRRWRRRNAEECR